MKTTDSVNYSDRQQLNGFPTELFYIIIIDAAVSTTQKALFHPDIHIIFLQRKFHNIVQTVLH